MDAKKLIAPYVKQSMLPSVDAAVKVADKSLNMYNQLKICYGKDFNVFVPAIVGASIISQGYGKTGAIERLIKISGKDFGGYCKKLGEVRELLNVPFNINLENIAEEINIPKRYALTARKIFQDLMSKTPDDISIQRPSMQAACLFIVGVERNHKREDLLHSLSKVCFLNPVEIVACEKTIRSLISGNYLIREKKSKEDEYDITKVRDEDAYQRLKEETSKALIKLRSEKDRKMKQTCLNFANAVKKS